MTGLIGQMWKRSNVWSCLVLMADDLQQPFFVCVVCCVFASTVRFLRNNPAAPAFRCWGGWLVGLVVLRRS